MSDLAVLGGPATVQADLHGRWPQITAADRDAVQAALQRGIVNGAQAPEISALEREWADYIDAKYCIAVNNGTAALHCCAAAAELGPGDEVIVPALTFIASAMAVIHQGATPAFCDVDRSTFNLDVDKVRERITERTRAIMPVHLHGLPADMTPLREIAREHGLAIIEDAAQAHGATYEDQRVGVLGDTGAFSLNSSKGLCGGEGGLFVTNNADAFQAARRLSMFGEAVPVLSAGEFRSYWSEGVGWNYRNQELPAALARSQLARLDEYNATAQANAEYLSRHLDRITGLTPPVVPPDRTSVFHKYRVRLDAGALGFDGPPAELRDKLIQALRGEHVEAVVWQVHPIPALPVFRRPLATWHPNHADRELEDWDPQEFPAATETLEQSFILGSETMPLYVQDESVIALYVEAITKVMDNLDEVVELEHEPLSFGSVEGTA